MRVLPGLGKSSARPPGLSGAVRSQALRRGTWPVALRHVRSWLLPWTIISRYWRAWSLAPPPPELDRLLQLVSAGYALPLYLPP